MTTGVMPKPAGAGRRRFVSLPAAAGIDYSAAWIISLSVGAPNPSVNAPGAQDVADFAGHGGPTMTMFVFAEGVAAVALAIVVLSVAMVARSCGARPESLAAAGFGRRISTAGAVYHAITQDRRGEDAFAGRDGRGHIGHRPEDYQPASLASAAGVVAGCVPGGVRAWLHPALPGSCLGSMA
jgi:hypothetical protein